VITIKLEKFKKNRIQQEINKLYFKNTNVIRI